MEFTGMCVLLLCTTKCGWNLYKRNQMCLSFSPIEVATLGDDPSKVWDVMITNETSSFLPCNTLPLSLSLTFDFSGGFQ